MKPVRLYIQNFMCYDKAFIDFSKFQSALVLGKLDENELYANGVGKTAIFKAIEYVLFNSSDSKLEDIIRDDTSFCNVTIDLLYNSDIYRISRTRTKKGTSDLSLYKRNEKTSVESDLQTEDEYPLPITKEEYWVNISGRRAADTEKELNKIINTNEKAFRNTKYFVQNNFEGLASTTAEKRRGILKEALSLFIYAKMEKVAKEKFANLTKEADKKRNFLEFIKDPEKEIENINEQLLTLEKNLKDKGRELNKLQIDQNNNNNELNELNKQYSSIESNLSTFNSIVADKNKLENVIKEFTIKKTNTSNIAKDLISQLSDLKKKKENITLHNISNEEIQTALNDVNKTDVLITSLKAELLKLEIPLPKDSVCDHCRQTMTNDHREKCQSELNLKILDVKKQIEKSKNDCQTLSSTLNALKSKFLADQQSQKNIEMYDSKIKWISSDLNDKKKLYSEYNDYVVKNTAELEEKKKLEQEFKEKLNDFKYQELNSRISNKKQIINNIAINLENTKKEVYLLDNSKSTLISTLSQKIKDKAQKSALLKELEHLDSYLDVYPYVLQAFHSNGIPTDIINNVLEKLQTKSNSILSKLRPGLQMLFVVEKTKNDGTESDTLDIQYFVNGRKRYYEQISGAMKLVVSFALKLGLAFLLEEEVGSDIKFILLDEIDQALDKATIDSLAEIIKFFQKEYSILIISHNDRLKEKFNSSILVRQNSNMVSYAKVV